MPVAALLHREEQRLLSLRIHRTKLLLLLQLWLLLLQLLLLQLLPLQLQVLLLQLLL